MKVASRVKVPGPLREVAEVFNRNGRKVYLVGGAVRDILRGKKASDWDLASDAPAEETRKMFRHVIPTGIKHGTVTVLYKGVSMEVTTFRTDGDYADGRRPDSVTFAETIEEDLSRRDFTMNAVAAELPSGIITDPYGGARDIEKKIIRCVGNAGERFREDGLRPLRAARFLTMPGFSADTALIDAIPECLHITAKVSPERVRAELEKIIMSENPIPSFEAMRKTGLQKLLLPELEACVNAEQKGYHKFDVWTHSVTALEYAALHGAPLNVRLAALMHDIGKPACASEDGNGVLTFYNHEKISMTLARGILSRLRFPNAITDNVIHLIGEHMFHYEEVWSDAAVRRFIIRAGEENLGDLFMLRAADSFAQRRVEPDPRLLLPLLRRIDEIRRSGDALSLKDLSVSGRDLITEGFKPGPRLGIVLNLLMEAALEDPELNTREKLLEIAKKQFSP